MTGVAGNMHFAVGELGVDFVHHHDHFARDILLGIFVAGVIRRHMAEGALLAERGTEGAHGRVNVRVRRQHFQVLGSRSPLFLRWILRRRSQKKKG